MRVLFIKLTSMGDLIHALPALTDAMNAIPGIQFDWVVDKNFSEVAKWHPAVNKIICTDHRTWRKKFFYSFKHEIPRFVRNLRQEHYDLVIDGQTNLKSALTIMLSRGTRCGLDRKSAREWLAYLAYQKKFSVPKTLHAIDRLRRYFSQIFNYPLDLTTTDYGIAKSQFAPAPIDLPANYLVFVHNASWPSKLYPINFWHALIDMAADKKLDILLPWGNQQEKLRASQLVVGHSNAHVLPFCSLSQMADILIKSKGAICSDTGLSHLAAALSVPAITMYGPTNVALIGTSGKNQQHCVSSFPCIGCYQHQCLYQKKKYPEPLCLAGIKPETLWQLLEPALGS
jgi:heptosyltransferase-1